MPPTEGEGEGEDEDGAAAVAPRAEMRDAPPFWSWRAIYLVVVGALAAEALLFTALTKIFNR